MPPTLRKRIALDMEEVDDSIPNIKAFIGQGIVFTAPHNALETAFPRVNGWSEVAKFFGL